MIHGHNEVAPPFQESHHLYPTGERYAATRLSAGGRMRVLQLQDLRARIERLDNLTRGLMKEVLMIREGNDPLLYLECRDYLIAIQDGIVGLESARVILARAVHRIEDSQR